MAMGLIGQKLGMTRLINKDGSITPVSVIKIEPNRVVQTKTVEVDGYHAIQVTTGKKINKKGEAKIRRVSSAIKGHYAKASEEIGFGLWEFRIDAAIEGNNFDVSLFGAGHYIDVTGRSKGKGFQGGVKRHNFSMQDATHGNSISHRAIGSTGQCQEPGRVFKGKKMAGHMGNEQVTEECLEVVRVDNERNLLLVKGAIPGHKKGFVKVGLSAKKNTVNSDISKQMQQKKDAQTLQEEEAKVAAVAKQKEVKAAKAAKKETAKVAKNTTVASNAKDDIVEATKESTTK